jgi:hypothetical protein
MFANHRTPVCLSLLSTDLPIWSTVETTGFISQKAVDRFHLLLERQNSPQSLIKETVVDDCLNKGNKSEKNSKKDLLWLEISPCRVIMTVQGNGKLSYRHYWEQGIYGISRYCLNGEPPEPSRSIRLQNFTRSLNLDGCPLPKSLRIEYELWSAKVQMGHYVLNLQINY